MQWLLLYLNIYNTKEPKKSLRDVSKNTYHKSRKKGFIHMMLPKLRLESNLQEIGSLYKLSVNHEVIDTYLRAE